jgi:hypothetical protein
MRSVESALTDMLESRRRRRGQFVVWLADNKSDFLVCPSVVTLVSSAVSTDV